MMIVTGSDVGSGGGGGEGGTGLNMYMVLSVM